MLTDYLILTGSALNYFGAITRLARIFSGKQDKSQPGQLILLQIFVSGVGVALGNIYLYVFLNPEYMVPFLAFGAALKYWAFFSALVAYKQYNLPYAMYKSFGISNAVVGTLLLVAFIARLSAGP